uniref:PHD-type domain-containing protein n=1 Tax=Caenorhabditis tropicalis TaxID=1561998 RepID=A0A1I7U4P5_9PELO
MSEEDALKIDEEVAPTTAEAEATSPEEPPPFEANAYIAKLIDFMRSTEQDANQKFSEFMAKTWSRPSDSADFFTDAFPMDTGGAKVPQNMMMTAQKRIAGTQRLMYAPPQAIHKATLGGPSSSGAPPTKKTKKQVPVIDDSIYCTTDQPCKTCDGVSQSGNQVLACKRCRDCYHMRCSIPPVSVDEASDPNFQYHCKTCLISRKIMDSSRSRSPSPVMTEAKMMKMGKVTKP